MTRYVRRPPPPDAFGTDRAGNRLPLSDFAGRRVKDARRKKDGDVVVVLDAGKGLPGTALRLNAQTYLDSVVVV